MNYKTNESVFTPYAEEKEDFVLGFLSEKHLNHYLNQILYGVQNNALFFSQQRCLRLNNQIRQTAKKTVLDFNYPELFFKEFRIRKKHLPKQVLKNEVLVWKNWIEQNSNFYVVFAVLSICDEIDDETQIYFLLREDREREDMLRYT